MKTRIFLFYLLNLLVLTFGCKSKMETDKSSENIKPNVVFILVDDLGWTDLGCYGSTFHETVHLDQFAKESTRFTNAYSASPVCSPTRASIMTGKYPTRVNITDWIKGDDPKDRKLIGPEDSNELALSEVTLAETFKQNGYKTFFAGKWHLGDSTHFPEDQGFDINKGGHHMGQPPFGYYSPYKNPRLSDGPEGEYLTDRLTDESIQFIKEQKKNPFFLYLAYYTVHTPIEACQKHVEKYRAKLAATSFAMPTTLPEHTTQTMQYQMNPDYASMVHSLDENFGRLMDALKSMGLDDKTIIVFTSDNGGLSTVQSHNAPTSVKPLRAGKGWCYEGGIRVPLMIKVPGLEQNAECHEPVVSMDFFPTLCKLANLDIGKSNPMDGKDLSSLLTGKHSLDRSSIYWHYPHYHTSGWTPGAAIRKGDWKLIEFYDLEETELYNLKNDIGEIENLASKFPDKVKELQAELKQLQTTTDAKMAKVSAGQ